MPTSAGERPLVDDEVQGSMAQYLQRILERATPESWVAGGEQDADNSFQTTTRTQQALQEREAIYRAGGPVTEMIDTRALMTYGTGVSFETDSDVEDDSGRTVDEWLDDQFPSLDVMMIEAGTQTYWAGDAWPEIVETRGGDFSHVNLVDPTTVDVAWDDHGEITRLRQVITKNGRPQQQPLDEDDVGHFNYKSSTGGPLGESLVEANRDEIEMLAANLRQRRNAIRLHGSPKYDVSVGSEGQSIPDRIMRRIRNKFKPETIDENTVWTHGGDIEISAMESPGFQGMDGIVETDVALVASGFGIPLEWTNFGSAGLGDGKPAESRMAKFERQARAEQTRRSEQFIEEIVRPILERYSPFPPDIDVQLSFGDVVSDQAAVADWLYSGAHNDLTLDERREAMGYSKFTDEEGELGYQNEEPDEPGGFGDLFGSSDATSRNFSDGRALIHDSVSEDDLTEEELIYHDIIERVLWSDETDRQLFAFDPEDVPEFVTERLREAIPAAVSSVTIETLAESQRAQLVDTLIDSLESQHGWSIRSIRENLQEMAPDLTDFEAERLGRDLTQSAVNKAREAGYRERLDMSEERFYWTGPMDHRKEEPCEWLVKKTNPHHGGTPVPLDELKNLVQEANERGDYDHDAREFSPHIQCRDQYVRYVE